MIEITEGHLLRSRHGWSAITPDVLDDLASFFGRDRDECLKGLAEYNYGTLADEWSASQPTSSKEMRVVYSETEAYIWGLTLWQGTGAYAYYHRVVDGLAQLQQPTLADPLYALDYGSGIGTSAIWLANHGYAVTIADVPGRTFDYAQHRLRRRGLPFIAISIEVDLPDLGSNRFSAIACFDVLEHLQGPDRVFAHLAGALVPNGLISVEAPFDAEEEVGGEGGYHLHENALRFGGGRFALYLSGHGWARVGGVPATWQRATGLAGRVARIAHYCLWRLSGLDIRYLPVRARE